MCDLRFLEKEAAFSSFSRPDYTFKNVYKHLAYGYGVWNAFTLPSNK